MNEERRKIAVEVLDLTDSEFEMTAPDFLQWVSDKIAELPEEVRDLVRVTAKELDPYGDSYKIGITCHYERLETDEELQTRIDEDRRYAEESEAHERRIYEIYKAKFG